MALPPPPGQGPSDAVQPMTFVTCVRDEARLAQRLLASPDLGATTIHEVMTIRDAPSVGVALEAALQAAAFPVVVLVDEDVWLPAGWARRFQAQWRAAEREGAIGLAGLSGGAGPAGAGAAPREVDAVGDALVALPRDTPLRVPPALGFHGHGPELSRRARAQGLRVVAVDAPVPDRPAPDGGARGAPEPVPPRGAGTDAGTAYHRWYYETMVWDRTTWLGVKALKSPADMWNYQEILSERRPSLVVELGTRFGGGTLFFASVIRGLGHRARVLTVDIDEATVDPRVKEDPLVELLVASSTSDVVARRIAELRAEYPGPVFAILDSDHRMAHVLAELRLLSPLLVPGDYLVVEDSNINGHPVLPGWGPGPYEALEAYLAEHPRDYVRDAAREAKFGFTFATRGFLVRA